MAASRRGVRTPSAANVDHRTPAMGCPAPVGTRLPGGRTLRSPLHWEQEIKHGPRVREKLFSQHHLVPIGKIPVLDDLDDGLSA